MAGDLNTDLGDMECDRRGAEIAAAITEAGLEDMAAHFLPRKRKWGRERRTWAMVRGGKAVRSRTDYILGTDRSLFRNVAVRDPRHNSDHYMLMGLLRGGTGQEHDRYITRRRRIPMKPPKRPTRGTHSSGIYDGPCRNRNRGSSIKTHGSPRRPGG